ncbi:hypothetical protein JVX98_15205 [Ensifer sp. PDNC004]|uniref:hypothetical protein n=1 Tax=Ensifer sp. PDNC004 TaxID=2811423 RepID=UPI001964D7EB|nr:hypothetical protein [Ensifer sp. PDNC004]QRY69531.1 hypothetical protein JVX98_15205 [Ensifer sp. PDNC004]
MLAPIRWACVLLCGFIVWSPANAQEGSDWAEMSSGATQVSGLGSVRYSVGYSNIGYDHFRSEIVVEWRDGAKRTQTIYEGIYDRPPAKVWGVQGHLCVSMQACARYEDACTAQVIAYRYDAGARSFAELENGEQCSR